MERETPPFFFWLKPFREIHVFFFRGETGGLRKQDKRSTEPETQEREKRRPYNRWPKLLEEESSLYRK